MSERRLYLAKYTEGVDPGSTSVRLELVIVVIIHGFGFGFVCVGINGLSSINQQNACKIASAIPTVKLDQIRGSELCRMLI